MLKLHFYFLMNKTTIGFLTVSILLQISMTLFASRFYEGVSFLDSNRNLFSTEFLIQTIGMTKFILVSTAVFLNVHCFCGANSRYSAFFGGEKKERLSFIVSKLTVISLIIILIAVHSFLAFTLTTGFLTPFSFKEEIAILFFWTGIEGLFFGFLTALILQGFNSIFSGILPLSGFWFLEANGFSEIITGNPWMKTLFQVVPHLIQRENCLHIEGTLLVQGLVLLILFLLNTAIFVSRDIK